jgi:hypothetical protein
MSAATATATIRLGIILSVLAVAITVGLTLVGDVSRWSLVVAVAVVGFVASWIQSGKVARAEHRPAVILSDRSLRVS